MLFFVACRQGDIHVTETGNPELTGRWSLQGHSSDPSQWSLGTSDAPVQILEARATVDQNGLLTEVTDQPFPLPSPGTFDLIASSGVMEFGLVPADYYGVSLSLAATKGCSIELSGLRADGAPFVLRTPTEASIDLPQSGFALDQTQRALLLSFDVAVWFEGWSLEEATLEDGVARIDPDHNPALYEAFQARLLQAPILYRDANANGWLDEGDEELARPPEPEDTDEPEDTEDTEDPEDSDESEDPDESDEPEDSEDSDESADTDP